MRELTVIEVNEVSGAGVIADSSRELGTAIGTIAQLFGMKDAKNAFSVVGEKLGVTIEAGIDLYNSFISIFK